MAKTPPRQPGGPRPLTPALLRALNDLTEHGPSTAAELAARLGLSPHTATNYFHELCGRQLVRHLPENRWDALRRCTRCQEPRRAPAEMQASLITLQGRAAAVAEAVRTSLSEDRTKALYRAYGITMAATTQIGCLVFEMRGLCGACSREMSGTSREKESLGSDRPKASEKSEGTTQKFADGKPKSVSYQTWLLEKLRDPAFAAAYLAEHLTDDDDLLREALSNVAIARGLEGGTR